MMNLIRLFLLLLVPSTLAAAASPALGQANTTIQLPTFGVSIDAAGVLQLEQVNDPGGRLLAARIAAARRDLPGDVAAPAELRFVSLNRLEAAVEANLTAGKPVDDVMQNLAGLQRVQYVMLLADSNDIVVAGPAEGWVDNGAGQAVGLTTGRPTVRLDHLLVALRTFPPNRRDQPFIGCTIDPTPEGLQRLQAFQQTVPRSVPARARAQVAAQLAAGSREALGMANVRVFGIPADTHLAKVLIEADYLMKCIGVGVAPPPVKMKTFVEALRGNPGNAVQRWWFTPNYQCVRLAADRQAMELVGQGVQLQSEDKAIGPGGQLLNANAVPSKASDTYAASFTAKYEEIAEAEPVFAQMRNGIDLLVAATFLQREDYYSKIDWRPSTFLSEQQLPIETLNTPKQAPCVANSLWKGSRLYTPAGGGVSILPMKAFESGNLLEDDGSVAKVREGVGGNVPVGKWWW